MDAASALLTTSSYLSLSSCNGNSFEENEELIDLDELFPLIDVEEVLGVVVVYEFLMLLLFWVGLNMNKFRGL